jgi:hypothetical protein
MRKSILITICLFVLTACITFSCKKKEFRGCNGSSNKFECTINGQNFEADSSGCSYDTLNRHVYLFAKDTSLNANILFSLYYTLQDMDIVLKPIDSLNSGRLIGFINGTYFDSKHGNFGMSVNSNKTVCGQFFMNDPISKINVSIGQFTEIPWVYWKP